MVVNYYSVKNCKYEVYENRPALFPPDNTDESLLREYGFVKMIDGRWCKFLSGTEYQRIIKMYPCDVTIDKSYNSLKYTSMSRLAYRYQLNLYLIFSENPIMGR